MRALPAAHSRAGSSACRGMAAKIAASVAEKGEEQRQHVLSVFVADEPGLINQVSAIFDEAGACAFGVDARVLSNLIL